MSLVVNHNLMAMNASRNLSTIFSRLATSTQRLSSGLRVNSAADDAAGLAVREMFRSDIAAINQGVRNAGDAISLLQTAEGALSVVDEKLTRMKELAQQAATGSYTTGQRGIMDSEYQAMAAEINRIANATDFNGVKLLDGSITTSHASGMKIHFGGGNSSAEDYYYISIADMRATESTGLQIGGGATADILAATTSFASGGTLIGSGYIAYSYDVSGDFSGTSGTAVLSDFAGFYYLPSGTTLSGTVDKLNLGTAARSFITMGSADVAASGQYIQAGNLRVFIASAGDLTGIASGVFSGTNRIGISLLSATSGAEFAASLVSAINAANANVFAVASGAVVMLVARDAGYAGNGIAVGTGTMSGYSAVAFTSLALSDGGATWAVASVETLTTGNKYLQLKGNDKGAYYDVTIQSSTTLSSGNLAALAWADTGTSVGDFSETEATGAGNWNGADILTQSAAQLALAQIDAAITTKEITRAGLGSLSNRLENTITNLQIQGENLQAAESRISDVDVALEMMEFTKNNILAQAATAMLAQANALPQLALQLLGGR